MAYDPLLTLEVLNSRRLEETGVKLGAARLN